MVGKSTLYAEAITQHKPLVFEFRKMKDIKRKFVPRRKIRKSVSASNYLFKVNNSNTRTSC